MTTPIRASDLVMALKRIEQERYAGMEPDALAAAIEDALADDDWCEDDGGGYCGNHDAWIAYHVDNFGARGVVLAPGSFDPEETGYAICTSAYRYDAAKSEESDRLMKEAN